MGERHRNGKSDKRIRNTKQMDSKEDYHRKIRKKLSRTIENMSLLSVMIRRRFIIAILPKSGIIL